MKNIDELTIKDVEIPAGRSLTADELDLGERALGQLLFRYESHLKDDLRQMLHAQAEKHTQVVNGVADVGFLSLDYDLMQPAELYQLINAADILGDYMAKRIERRLVQRAAAGDLDAAQELALLRR